MMADYSDEFAAFARDFLNPDLTEEERISALYGAIESCGESEESMVPKSDKPASGLALVFGGPKKKGG